MMRDKETIAFTFGQSNSNVGEEIAVDVQTSLSAIYAVEIVTTTSLFDLTVQLLLTEYCYCSKLTVKLR